MGNYLNSYKIPIIQKTEVINDEFREEIIKKEEATKKRHIN